MSVASLIKTDPSINKFINLTISWFDDYSCGAGDSVLKEIQKFKENNEDLFVKELSTIETIILENAFDKAMNDNSDKLINIFSYFHQYQIAFKKSNNAIAIISIKKALHFLPQNLFLLEKCAEISYNSGDYLQAMKCCEILIAKTNSKEYHLLYYKSLYQAKKFRKLVLYWPTIIKHFPNAYRNEEIQSYFGIALLRLKKYEEAKKILKNVNKNNKLPTFNEVKKQIPNPDKLEVKITHARNNGIEVSYNEEIQLGMSYLFHSQYKKSLELFTKIKNDYFAKNHLQYSAGLNNSITSELSA